MSWYRDGKCVVACTGTEGHASSRHRHRDDRSSSHLEFGAFSPLMLERGGVGKLPCCPRLGRMRQEG